MRDGTRNFNTPSSTSAYTQHASCSVESTELTKNKMAHRVTKNISIYFLSVYLRSRKLQSKEFSPRFHREWLITRQKGRSLQHTEVPEKAGGISNSPAKRSRAETDHELVKTVLKFAKLSENATVPTRGSARAAGYDLYSAYDYSIAPLDKAIVKTDIQIAVPAGCYGRVAPRSGLAAKHFIDVGAGVVDEDYRGNVGVVLFNFSKETFEVKKGDRVAQLICERISYPNLEQHDTLDETTRGAGGFGSTGRN